MNAHVDECRYVVVQFLKPPDQNINDYVCIPNSWIQKRRGTDSKSIVAYPNERPSVTERRIKDGEKPSRIWNHYTAVVKYEAFSYEEANKFIWLKIQAASNENSLLYMIDDDSKRLPVTATKKNRSSVKRINFSKPHLKRNNKKLNVDKAMFVDTISNTSIDSKTLISSNPPGFDSPEKTMSRVTNGINSSHQALGSCSQSTKRRTLQYTWSPLNIVKQVTNNHQTLQKNQPSFIDHNNLHKLEIIRATMKRKISSIQAFDPDLKKKLKQVSDIGPQILLKPDTECTELERTNQTPSPHNQTFDDASDHCSDSTEHQDLDGQMVVDKSFEASCFEQNVISEQRSKNQFSDEIVATDDVSSTQYIDDGMRSMSPRINSEVMTTTREITLKQSEPSVESIIQKADMLENELVKLVRKLKLNVSQTYQAIDDLCKSTARSVEAFERLVNKVENLQISKKSQDTAVTPKKVTAEVQTAAEVVQDRAEMKEKENPDGDMMEDEKRSTGKESKRREDDADDDNEKDNADENEGRKAPRKVRGNIRTFVLPPEYDPADSRWTLKYRKNDPKLGLVELIPNSKVFISSIRLSHCKRVAKDCKMLARMLFVEIFTQSALSVCSLTGARAKAFDINGTHIRPGLDENARMVILSFVENYAREKDWGVFELQSVINSMRSKIQEMRAKHGPET